VPVRVVLGAEVLARPRVRDVALALAEDGLYQPFWSDGIIVDADRRLPPEMPRAARDYLFAELERAFPEARVTWPATVLREVPLVVDPEQSHVTSVALLAHADAVVTDTAAVADSLDLVDVEPWTPDAFVTFVLDATPRPALHALLRMVRRRWLQHDDSASPDDPDLLARLSGWARRALGPSSADLLDAHATRARLW